MSHTTATAEGQKDEAAHSHEGRMYLRFAAMIGTSTIVMFLLTYTNVFVFDHVRWSEERLYMAVLMGSAMAIVMLGFMWGMMYRRTAWNLGIVAAAVVVGAVALTLSRSQALVDDTNYMDAMIPHHSIAILTSERAQIRDLRVRELADEIAATQRREIDEMSWLVDDIEKNGVATTAQEAQERAVPAFSGSP